MMGLISVSCNAEDLRPSPPAERPAHPRPGVLETEMRPSAWLPRFFALRDGPCPLTSAHMERFAGKHLVIFGCGYIGTAVARATTAHGATVTALTRNSDTAAGLRAEGIAAVVSDLVGGDWQARIRRAPDFVLNCVSSGGGGIEAYRHSYVGGMASIVEWAKRVGPVGTMVYTSSTSVYPQGGGAMVNEMSSTVGGGERAQILLQAEALMADAANAWRSRFILRLAGIYGPGRHALLEQVRAGEVTGTGEVRLNLIHRDDAVAAILACFTASDDVSGEIFNVADDAPAPKSDVVAWLAAQLSVAVPHFTGEAGTGRRGLTPDRVITNAKIKSKLGWQPAYPTFREGYGSFLSR